MKSTHKYRELYLKLSGFSLSALKIGGAIFKIRYLPDKNSLKARELVVFSLGNGTTKIAKVGQIVQVGRKKIMVQEGCASYKYNVPKSSIIVRLERKI